MNFNYNFFFLFFPKKLISYFIGRTKTIASPFFYNASKKFEFKIFKDVILQFDFSHLLFFDCSFGKFV